MSEPLFVSQQCNGSGLLYGRASTNLPGLMNYVAGTLYCEGCPRCAKPARDRIDQNVGNPVPPAESEAKCEHPYCDEHTPTPAPISPTVEDFSRWRKWEMLKPEKFERELVCKLGIVACQQRDLLTEIRDMLRERKP